MSEPSVHPAELFRTVVLRSVDDRTADWFISRRSSLSAGYDRNTFLAAYAGAGRRMRAFPVRTEGEDAVATACLGGGSVSEWTLDRFARCALIAAALDSAPSEEHSCIVDEVFRTGDNAEREALLAGLMLLPEPGRYVETAVEACRSNVATVFAAVACENAYPSVYFSEAAFNQMILKAVFIDLPLSRVVGLALRKTDDLAAMARSYASERRAAGRSIPGDLDLILSVSAGGNE